VTLLADDKRQSAQYSKPPKKGIIVVFYGLLKVRQLFFCLYQALRLWKFIERYKTIKREHQINQDIRDREIRVIGDTGEQLGIMSAREAQAIADERGLDLVKISPNANPPVCKIMNYGKYLFELNKKAKEAKKNQKVVEIKEVWLSMTIDVGDLNVKAKQAQKFLSAGNKVKVSIRMRGRQMAHANLGLEVMKRFFELVKDSGTMEKQPLTEGRSIWMMLAPLKA
jgi:translation initiation factor IF-3